MPKGGFGNLIALPLQKLPRDSGFSIFVNESLQPYPDQWRYLASLQPMPPEDIEPTILRATGGVHPLDVTFIDEEDYKEPWKRPAPTAKKLEAPMPKALNVTLANLVYFDKVQLPQPLANRLIRLAAFQNPEFYKAQAMRLSVWDTPRVIGCAENYPLHIALPRGCLDAANELMRDNGIRCDLRDERFTGHPIDVGFAGTLRLDQETAVSAMLHHDTGVLCAPTAFGKTVTAAAIIARRGVNTLVLVHRTELLKQWQERLRVFLNLKPGDIGSIGGGKARPTGKIDIAVMQSLSRQGEVDPLVETYGQVIVDECHHIGAVSFDAILKRVQAKYVLGLTATPFRRDGQQPIIFMQCGPIRYTASTPAGAPHDLSVAPHMLLKRIELSSDAGIQEVFRSLASDLERTAAIAAEILDAFALGRKVLVLTERTEHLDAIRAALEGKVTPLFVLHGRMSKRQRTTLTSELAAQPPDTPHVLLATGKLVGEGFDHPPLDTLVLAMPISWKGTLQQYAGRLHREHATKTDVRIIDIVDTGPRPSTRCRRNAGESRSGSRRGRARAPGRPAAQGRHRRQRSGAAGCRAAARRARHGRRRHPAPNRRFRLRGRARRPARPHKGTVNGHYDNPDNVALLVDLLQADYRVLAANSGRRALELARSEPTPDLILLDVMMPGMDGYAVLAALREDARTRDIPVIFVTAMDTTTDEEHGLKQGAVDYITKPIRPAIVQARVRTHLELKRSRDWLSNQNVFLEEEIARRMAENLIVQDVSIHALGCLAEMRDPETGNHIRRTQGYVDALARRLHNHPRFKAVLTDPVVRQLAKSAPLHDIGKVGIPDHILQKPGKLTAEEWAIMQTHARLGAEAIEHAERDAEKPVAFLALAREIAHWHHEKWDGSGYPDGLAGEAIPISARLMALADVFDALISVRVYKAAMSFEQAHGIIVEGRGRHFDPDVVDAYLAIVDEFTAIAERYRDDETAGTG